MTVEVPNTSQANPSHGVTGGCLCGAVRYQVRGPLRGVVYCHCEQCQRTSGHFVAATAALTRYLEITEERGLRWYRSSDVAQRGFCQLCGSSLFYAPDKGDRVSIQAGSMDVPVVMSAIAHIFVAEAKDYYEITDDLPKHDGQARFPAPG